MAERNGRSSDKRLPVGAVDESKRIKQWAPRSKNGCVTCRRRKVRCDEAKPVCGNCVATRRYCGGSYYQDSAQATEIVRNTAAAIPRLSKTPPKSVRPTNHRGWEIVPEGWDMVEAWEYPPAKVRVFSTHIGSVNSDAFLARVIADRIVWVSCCQRAALSPSTVHGTRDLWFRFYDLIQKHLRQINHDLTHAQNNALDYLMKMRIFERICDLMEAEHILCLSGWRAHFDGYFALLKIFGLPKCIPRENPVFVLVLRSMMVNAVLGNTVTKIDKQSAGIYDFDDTEVVEIFGREPFVPFPCPKALFAEILAINRLRLTSTTCKPGAILPIANTIYERINFFRPCRWRETAEFEMPDTSEVVLVAKIFQLSVSLYGILSLGLEHVSVSTPNWPDKTTTTAELVMLLGKTLRLPKCASVMTWPCAVAGVAAADGPEASRRLIHQLLMRIDADVLAYGIAAHTIERLEAFWLSGKTAWEDCWNDFYLLW